MWSGVGYNECLQKSNGNFDDSEESDIKKAAKSLKLVKKRILPKK